MMDMILKMMGGLSDEDQDDMKETTENMVMDSRPYQQIMALLINIDARLQKMETK